MSVASTALLLCSTFAAVSLSLLLFHPRLFADRPVQQFLLTLAPWWMSYLSARWYVRLAERSSLLYHPLGCLAQCCVWVFHWVLASYRAHFVGTFTWRTYLVTVFCPAIAFLTEGLFHSLLVMGFCDTSNMGVYEHARKTFGNALIFLFELWYLVDAGPRQQTRNRVRGLQSRSMTM